MAAVKEKCPRCRKQRVMLQVETEAGMRRLCYDCGLRHEVKKPKPKDEVAKPSPVEEVKK